MKKNILDGYSETVIIKVPNCKNPKSVAEKIAKELEEVELDINREAIKKVQEEINEGHCKHLTQQEADTLNDMLIQYNIWKIQNKPSPIVYQCLCPNCSDIITDKKATHCAFCGQALDWSGNK